MSSRVLVTGANGFVGRVLCQELTARGHSVCAAVRNRSDAHAGVLALCDVVDVGDISKAAIWRTALGNASAVIHCAAKTAAGRSGDREAERRLWSVNVDATKHLAVAAAASGVRRLVFVSSIKVNGEYTEPGQSFTSHDIPDPQDAYARSKLQAEMALRDVEASTGLEVVVVRPPLVFGPGAQGNLGLLIRALRSGVPLPFGSVANKRALVDVQSLADLLADCLQAPVAGRTLLAKTDEELSTAEMLTCIAKGLGVKARLVNVPLWLLTAAGAAFGKTASGRRLLGSLQVNDSDTRIATGWRPRQTTCLGLQQMVRT
jgi:nucleoside-diphosphate-sugar epimerase